MRPFDRQPTEGRRSLSPHISMSHPHPAGLQLQFSVDASGTRLAGEQLLIVRGIITPPLHILQRGRADAPHGNEGDSLRPEDVLDPLTFLQVGKDLGCLGK